MDYFDDVKNYIDITFTDDATDKKLRGVCERAEAYLSKRAGVTLSFSLNMDDQSLLQLLFDCIRYIWSGALDEFAINYADDLFGLRANIHADAFREGTDET